MTGAECVQVDVDGADAEVVSALLWQHGVTGVLELDLDAGRRRLVAGLAASAPATTEALRRRLEPFGPTQVFASHHEGWLDAWRPFARPVHVGAVVVHPPWEDPFPAGPPPPGTLVVPLDPGRAFGQGAHATTRLMLAALQARDLAGATVVDVGCGSGVLAVVAARLGAARVVAVDVDQAAVEATRVNADRNGVTDRVEVSTTPVADLDVAADVVLANILGPVLVELAPALAARTGAGGHLVLCGVLGGQRADVLGACAQACPELVLLQETTAPAAGGGRWSCLTLRAPGGPGPGAGQR